MDQRLSRREQFAERVLGKRQALINLCVDLVRISSENPPGETTAIADAVERTISVIPGLQIQRIAPKEGVVNLVLALQCGAPGRRLIINGHLDTFPVGDPGKWSVPPLSGQILDGRIYGRGVSDMKAGLAAGLLTLMLLAEERDALCGELVLTFVGDEETGGRWGTSYLLENVPEASGDAMLSGDAGSPQVIRFGEKGQLWIELTAQGIANHGAHVHLGVNAIEALLQALEAIRGLRNLQFSVPDEIRAAMVNARPVSESVSGEGEFETLQSITVNLGFIEGGTAVNIIPDRARALLDIRLPPGLSTGQVTAALNDIIRDRPGIAFKVLTRSEPNVTDPNHELVQLAQGNARDILGIEVVRNMRVGMSDARLYRQQGIPSIVYGPTPHNMGGADEYVEIDEAYKVFYVHAMTAYDYLSVGLTA